MTDLVPEEIQNLVKSRIRGENTSSELALRHGLLAVESDQLHSSRWGGKTCLKVGTLT